MRSSRWGTATRFSISCRFSQTPKPEVRAGVADAIGRMQSAAAAAVLHLQLLLCGDRGGGALDLAHACMLGLLRCAPERYGKTIAAYLEPPANDVGDDDNEDSDGDDSFAELAALAIAEARIDDALPALLGALAGRRASRFTSNVMLAIASLRRDDAAPQLLCIAETGNEALAVQALVALRSSGRLERTDVIDRARAIVEARRSRALRDILDAHASARR
jgi:hypothetical protein